MKKILLSVSLVVLAFVATSCNSKSEPFYTIYGSLESVMGVSYAVGPRGEKYEIGPGSAYPFPSVPTDVNRSRFLMGFTLVDESSDVEKDDNIPIKLSYYQVLPTQNPSSLGGVDYDDPVLVVNGQQDRIYYEPGTIESSISTIQNYLNMMIYHYVYFENKEAGEEYAVPTISVEVDPEIEEASGNDIINMYLRFDNNRNAKEEISDGAYSYYMLSVDMQSLPSIFGFPVTDASGNNITYKIKLHYNAYADAVESDDDELIERTATVDWTYGKPFVN